MPEDDAAAASSWHPAMLTLETAEDGLRAIEQHAMEIEALLLIAQRQREELLAAQAELTKEQKELIAKQRSSRRKRPDFDDGVSAVESIAPNSPTQQQHPTGEATSLTSSPQAGPSRAAQLRLPPSPSPAASREQEVYDWVCEITKLSDVSTHGWRVCYSERFLSSCSEDEKRYVLGTEPLSRSAAGTLQPRQRTRDSDDDDPDRTIDLGTAACLVSDGDEAQGSSASDGWDGAVVAVLGLFDKGKTFVLNHLTGSQLPSGKKVSTKGLSFKHVDVEGTKFIVLDSEGSYAPVKVENELSVVEKEISERFIQDVIFDLADYFLCVVNDFTSLDQRYLDRLTRSLQNSKKHFQEVIVVHNCKTVMEQEVMDHIFHSQILFVYGRGKVQTTRIAALNPITGELEEKDVLWFKTDFSRHVILANEDCELGDRTNGWTFALLKNWLRSAFVPVNRRFSVLQSVLQSCNGRLSAYFKTEPELSVEMTDDPRTRLIRAKARTEDSFRLQQTSVDASGLLLTRPNSFVPAIDIVRDNALYTIIMDVPGMTSDDIRLSRQNVTTIVKGTRLRPYPELLVQKVERQERQYGDFTLTFKVPQEYERKFDSVTVVDGVLRLTFKPDADEESVTIR